jgi:hypothetical protein
MINKFKWEGVALIAYEGEFDGSDPSSARSTGYRRTFIDQDCVNEDRERFYNALLKINWLAPKIRYAILKELGLSQQEQNRQIEEAVTTTLRHMIAETQERLRRNGQRPRGGVRAQAIAEIAESQGMSVEALERRLERNVRRQRLKEQARRSS